MDLTYHFCIRAFMDPVKCSYIQTLYLQENFILIYILLLYILLILFILFYQDIFYTLKSYMQKNWAFHSWQLTWCLLLLSYALFVLNVVHVGTLYSLKLHRSNCSCEGLRFLLASLVKNPLISIALTSFYIWLCIIAL